MEALYLTGHSPRRGDGGPAGAADRRDEQDWDDIGPALRGTHTYGQPMVGSPALAATCDADPLLGERLFRYVYEGDPIPGMPSRDTGRWAHFGHRRHHVTGLWDAGWRQGTSNVGQIRFAGQLAVAFGSLARSQLLVVQRIPVPYRIDDHRTTTSTSSPPRARSASSETRLYASASGAAAPGATRDRALGPPGDLGPAAQPVATKPS
jgi:hypothetical protein